MEKGKEIKEYKATLIGKDGFSKVMMIREPRPVLFIPKQGKINVCLENPPLYARPPKTERIFMLDEDKSWRNKLVYKEV